MYYKCMGNRQKSQQANKKSETEEILVLLIC